MVSNNTGDLGRHYGGKRLGRVVFRIIVLSKNLGFFEPDWGTDRSLALRQGLETALVLAGEAARDRG